MMDKPKIIELDIAHGVRLHRTVKDTLYGTEEIISISMPNRGELTLYTRYPEKFNEVYEYLNKIYNVNLNDWINHIVTLKP